MAATADAPLLTGRALDEYPEENAQKLLGNRQKGLFEHLQSGIASTGRGSP